MSPPPPFDALAARRLREALGMTHAHVAHGMWAAYGLRVAPGTVAAWERGEAVPSAGELPALAGALWCAPGELLAAPTTLREHRLARGLADADVARRIGMDLASYRRAERTGDWPGDERQEALLGEVLELRPAELFRLTGRAERLARLLHGAVTTRWQAYSRPVAALVAMDRERTDTALERLHGGYQARMVASLSWGEGGGATAAQDAGRRFLAELVDRFWAELPP
ncbi:helix-turn-helix domain-containing protein [Streptomyces pactum]|uniref:helix-turn-helix domain-containing protein n=1 Tax=Streptomyces pactum TaxID=68249 RepID=UPI0027DCD591|nr:helix-turn-helix transcriptional regulator [Streptomyces pactum]